MSLFSLPSTSRTLRVLAHLLRYPDAELRAHLGELRDALHAERALGARRLAELDALIASLARADALDVEADYVQLFDGSRSCALHLFEHVHGDSRDRGPAMVDLAMTYERAGLVLRDGELPDHLPVLLEFASTQPPREARALLGETAHILNRIFAALDQRGSLYAAALGACLELAGETPRPVKVVDDEPIDAAWAEPPAFDGCSTRGQSRPGAPQAIHIVKPAASPASARGVQA